MTPRQRRWVFLAAAGGLLTFYLWGLVGLPGFGAYPGPYGDVINAIAVAQTHATGVVSAVNFEYRGFDILGEEFILFIAATGVATVLRHLCEERDIPAVDVNSSGTIALISFFVGVEVAAAFVLIVGELLEQALIIREGADR